jgi:hypothetical protein
MADQGPPPLALWVVLGLLVWGLLLLAGWKALR